MSLGGVVDGDLVDGGEVDGGVVGGGVVDGGVVDGDVLETTFSLISRDRMPSRIAPSWDASNAR